VAGRNPKSASCCATSPTWATSGGTCRWPTCTPNAELAAEASEAAAAQGAFWPTHDLLLEHQDALGPADLVRYADQLGLDVERFKQHLREHAGARRIAEDVEGADLSGVSGTPTFFINGRHHYGAYDIAALSAAVRGAGARANWRRDGGAPHGSLQPG
jgi:protein-disulfide isomerase